MTPSRADTHDLDKLNRWYGALSASQTGEFPVHALFLVTAADKYSHDIFRNFRSGFETLGGQFHHLMIFGQHGPSTTVTEFLAEFGIPGNSLSVLMLFIETSSDTVYALSLPDESGEDTDQCWQEVLNTVESSVKGTPQGLELASLDELTSYRLSRGSMVVRWTQSVGQNRGHVKSGSCCLKRLQ